ncbi:MAG: metallophosphoesterase [Armatimonadetes bacterium]|nr:metallophosphoesterase [Armatimonadota bacterium]
MNLAILLLALRSTASAGEPPPPVFRTEVPESRLNVIAGAPTDTSIKLNLMANETTAFSLKLDGSPKVVSGKLDRGMPKSITLDGLKGGHRYEYTLSAGKTDLKGEFVTAPPTGSSFLFTVQADSHLDGNSDLAVYETSLKNQLGENPDFLIDLGDTFMVDKYPRYQDALGQYLAQRYWFSLIGKKSSVFLCLGNHDGETGWVQKGQTGATDWARENRRRYFPTIEKNGFYTGAPEKGLYYSWKWGDALFVVLDPFVATTRKPKNSDEGWNWTLGTDQFKWFKDTLRASKAKYKFVIIHHLVGGFGKDARGGADVSHLFEWGDSKGFPENRDGWGEPIHSIMKACKVTAVLHGHDHLYAHEERDGITYLEVPQPSQARGDNTSDAEEYGYRSGTILGSSGHIRISVSPSQAKFEYVKTRLNPLTNGEVVDTFSLKPGKS